MASLTRSRFLLAAVGAALVPAFGRLALAGTGHEHDLYRYLVPVVVGAVAGYLVGLMRERWLRQRDALQASLVQREQQAVELATLHGALAERRRYLQAILDHTALVIYLKDTEGRYILANREYERLSQVPADEIAGKTDFDLFPEPVAQLFHEQDQEVLAHAGPRSFEETIPLPDGVHSFLTEKFPLRAEDGTIYAVGGTCVDVTAQRRIEQELQRTKKLESVGLLAGGIAHDFNNMLGAVLGNLDLALHTPPHTEVCRELVADAKEAVQRATGLTQQLLTFSRGGAPVRATRELGPLVRDSVRFVMRGSTLAHTCELPDGLWASEVDAGQLGQVLQNLLLNADQAMDGHGTVAVVGRNVPDGAAESPALEAGRPYVCLEVCDNGPGIPDELRERVFDPYFTTRADGSGLGLAIAHAIVAKHDGAIVPRETPGGGATFALYLPASDGPAEVAAEGDGPPVRGCGRVLVMDDDDVVRRVDTRMLANLGYEASTVRDGAQAVELYREMLSAGQPFDAVVLDLSVPGGMGGEEAAREILSVDPAARVIATSGYSNSPVLAHFAEHGFKASLPKPHDLAALGRVLADVLRESA